MTTTDFPRSHLRDETQPPYAAREPATESDQTRDETQTCDAALGTDFPASHSRNEIHSDDAGGELDQDGSAAATLSSKPIQRTPLADPFLSLAADILDDAEDSRIANENRLRQLTRTETDKDGKNRGFGIDENDPDVVRVAALVENLERIEHQAGLNLQRLLRKHLLGPWVKAQKGIGDKQGARLLAVIGDPYINMSTGEIRTVSQLWAYCGHGDPARRRFKGMSQADLFALGNPVAKSRIWLIASQCKLMDGVPDKNGRPRTRSPYRDVYDDRKEVTVGRVHARDCVRCGPSGHPALAGSPWSDKHRDFDALRITGKEILRDLWIEAKRIHELGSGHRPNDTHRLAAAAD